MRDRDGERIGCVDRRRCAKPERGRDEATDLRFVGGTSARDGSLDERGRVLGDDETTLLAIKSATPRMCARRATSRARSTPFRKRARTTKPDTLCSYRRGEKETLKVTRVRVSLSMELTTVAPGFHQAPRDGLRPTKATHEPFAELSHLGVDLIGSIEARGVRSHTLTDTGDDGRVAI